MEDKELIQRSQKGDGEAFGLLAERYKTKVFNLAFSVVRDRVMADDLAQDVFIKAYFALRKFKFKSEFGTWLYRIAVNHIKDYFRKTRRLAKEVPLENIAESALAVHDLDRLEEAQVRDRRKALLAAALQRLPEKHRVILALRDIQGLSYEEVSRVLGISPGTVDSRLHRARKKLREKMTAMIGREGGGYAL